VCNTRSCKYSLDAPDYERKCRSKHVEQPRNTQLPLVGHFRKLYYDARNHEYQEIKYVVARVSKITHNLWSSPFISLCISVRMLYRNLQYWTQREFFKCLRRISYLRHLFVVRTKESFLQLPFLHYHGWKGNKNPLTFDGVTSE